MHPDSGLWLPEARSAAAFVLTCRRTAWRLCGAVVVIQVEAAIPMSRAMRPPVRHRPVFSSTQPPAVSISTDPAVSAAATRRNEIIIPVSASLRSGTVEQSGTQVTQRDTCRRNVGTRS